MKIYLIILLMLFLSNIIFAQTDIMIRGNVKDQNNKPVGKVKVKLYVINMDTDTSYKEAITDKNGVFTFKVTNENSYIINFNKSGYLNKSISNYNTSFKEKDTIKLLITLRSRKSALIKSSDITIKDLGITLKEAIKKYKIDTSEFKIQNEPPDVVRGFSTELGDRTILYLQIKRKEYTDISEFTYNNILNEKIIGIGLVSPNCKKKKIGKGFVWWGIKSHYCN